MTLVVDSSLVVAALVDDGPEGRWAEGLLLDGPLHAPDLMPFEAANVLRRLTSAGRLSADIASLAHRNLLSLPVVLVPYEAVAHRAWELRENITAFDAAYVAVAELIRAPLATLDRKLAAAPGTRCEFRLP